MQKTASLIAVLAVACCAPHPESYRASGDKEPYFIDVLPTQFGNAIVAGFEEVASSETIIFEQEDGFVGHSHLIAMRQEIEITPHRNHRNFPDGDVEFAKTVVIAACPQIDRDRLDAADIKIAPRGFFRFTNVLCPSRR
ncbi:MAG: hypothetical protein AAF386_08255 [Pseudomonadota bacterium]